MKERYFIHTRAYWRVIDFIESYCRYTEGELQGQLIKLPTWMKWWIRTTYGRYDRTTHMRAVREAVLEIPKKNGKSMLASALTLYHSVADGYFDVDGNWVKELGPEVACGAVSRDQAKIVFNTATWMVKQEPRLLQKIRPMQYELKLKDQKGEIHVLSSDAESKEGMKLSAIILDEIHVYKDWKFYNTLKGAGASRRQPITIMITTAGVYDPTTLYHAKHEYAMKVIDDWTYDPAFHASIYAAPYDLTDEECLEPEYWKTANPNLGKSVQYNFLEDLARQCKNDPTQLNQFKRYHLNIPTSSHSEWIPSTLIKSATRGGKMSENIGKRCWIGLDFGATDDLTAISLLFNERGHFQLETRIFCTANKVDAIKNNSQHITYMKWVKEGWIEIAGETDTDLNRVEEVIHELVKTYKVRSLTYDPAFIFQMVSNLSTKYAGRGKGFLNPFNMNAKETTPPMREIQSWIKNGELEMYGNPVLEWMFGNVEIMVTGKDYIFPNKAKAKGKIDAVVSSIYSVDGYLNDKYKDGGTKYLIIGGEDYKL